MRRLLVAVSALAAIVGATFVAACGDDVPPPTGPSPSVPAIVALTISGPSTLAPGQSVQYTASVRWSDGTVQTAAEAGVRWARGDAPILLQVDASGRVTALDALGDTTLSVSVPNPAIRQNAQAVMEITVVPEGTYRIAGKVTEAESPSSAIRGARVEVTPGALVTSTDLSGRYKLHGVPADAHIRVTAAGYVPHERSLRLTGHATEDVPLTLSAPQLTIDDGPYTLAIDAVTSCSNFPLAYQHRSYEAVVTQTGREVAVALTEPRFRVNEIGKGNRFTGRVVGAVATFTLDHFDTDSVFLGPTAYPSVVERLPNGEFLVVTGTAVATASAGSVSGPLSGGFWLWGVGFPTNLQWLGTCASQTNRFTLTPR